MSVVVPLISSIHDVFVDVPILLYLIITIPEPPFPPNASPPPPSPPPPLPVLSTPLLPKLVVKLPPAPPPGRAVDLPSFI